MSYINNTLPVKISVLKRLYLDNYLLQIGRKQIRTKSKIPLEVGQYLVEIHQNTKMELKNLKRVMEFDVLDDGLELLDNCAKDKTYYKSYTISKLLNAQSKEEYMLYKTMLFGLSNGVYKFPIIYRSKPLLLELRARGRQWDIYIYYDVFGALCFVAQDGVIVGASSEFGKVCDALAQLIPSIICAPCSYKPYQITHDIKG